MSYTNHSLPYNQDDMEFTQPQYPDFNHYPSDRLADSAAEGRISYPSQLHPHPLFTRQGNTGHSIIQNRSLEPHIHHSVYHSQSPFTNHSAHYHTTPQNNNWPPYDHSINPQNYSYPPYPTPSPFPPPRLSPPPQVHHTPIHFKAAQNDSPTSSQNQSQRLTLAGSLDPSTGIFYRTPEHPRLRTAQACEKCRTRKAKCSGEHPTCKRCLTRGLVCEYAKEGRVRGPNKTKSKPSNSGNDSSSHTPANTRNTHPRIGPRGRTSSINSSGSSELPDPPGAKVKREQEAGPKCSMETARRNSLSSAEHRSSRPRRPDLQLESASGRLYRSSNGDDLDEPEFPHFPRYQSQGEYGQHGQVDTRQLQREQQMHLQKNMTAIQTDSQGRSTPSSSSSQGRLLHGMPHTQTDHLITLGIPYNISPLQSPSMSEEYMYPPSYLQQQHHQPFPQYPVGNGSRNAIDVTTSGSSPHTSVSGGTSSMNSPLSPASAPPFVISPSASRINMKLDLDMTGVDPTLRDPRSGLGGSGSVPIEPVWIDDLGQVNAYTQLNSNSEHPIQGTDERVQNGFLDDNKYQNGMLEGNPFMKNGQGRPDSQQDHFHGQPQSRNETQHYPALDLQMC